MSKAFSGFKKFARTIRRLHRKALGRIPTSLSNVRLKASALLKPTEAATLSILFRGINNRRRASVMRTLAMNSAGAVPNSALNKRAKLRGDMHVLCASASIERSWLRLHKIQDEMSAKRSQD